MKKKLHKVYFFLLTLLLTTLLVSCKKTNISKDDLSGIWQFQKEVIHLGGETHCVYEYGFTYIKFKDDHLYFDPLIIVSDINELKEDKINDYLTNHEENYVKLLKFDNKNTVLGVYDDNEDLMTIVSPHTYTYNKVNLYAKLTNNRSNEDILIKEVVVKLTKTNL